MSAYGTHRVRLNVDLTRYHQHLMPGVEGTSVPGARTTEYGSFDHFWAVRYDCCGHLMDTVTRSLTIIDEPGGGAS